MTLHRRRRRRRGSRGEGRVAGVSLATPAQAFQFGDVSANEGLFFGASPGLKLEFAGGCGLPGSVMFAPGQMDREPCPGEMTTPALGMERKAKRQVGRAADVQRAVGTAKDVDDEGARHPRRVGT